jgi:hypothetical protein
MSGRNGQSGGGRSAPAGFAAGGLATVAETDGVDAASASPSSSPAATRQEQSVLDGAAQQNLQQQHMLAAQAQVSHLFDSPGGLQQVQAALQTHATLFGGNAPPPRDRDESSYWVVWFVGLNPESNTCKKRGTNCFTVVSILNTQS